MTWQNSLISELKNQAVLTAHLSGEFLKEVNLSTALLSLALIYIIFARGWGLKRILSFSFLLFLLFILLVRMEAYILAVSGSDNAILTLGIGRTIFLIIAGLGFIYNALVKE